MKSDDWNSTEDAPAPQRELVFVIDFGAQYTQLIARRV